MLPMHQRLAELWMLQKSRVLTEDEYMEILYILEANLSNAIKYASLCNLSAIASQTDDIEWLREIIVKLDKLEIEFRLKKPASFIED
jgi:methyltransferase-like protein